MELTCCALMQTLVNLAIRPLNYIRSKLKPSLAVNVQRLVIKFSPFKSNKTNKRELLESIKTARNNLEQLTESANSSLRRPSCLPLLLAESTRQSWIGHLLNYPKARVEYLETVDGRKLLVAVILERVK